MGDGRVIDNPISGERIVICQTGTETNGQLLSFDLFLPPGGHVPAAHAHPAQQERFTVVAGRLRFRFGRRTVLVAAGQSLLVEPGTAHWFGNAGAEVAQARVEVRPALRMQELLERTGVGVANVSDLALVLLEFPGEVAVPHVPAGLVQAVLAPFGWLARRRARPDR
jgi:mannose-6-phosphate isomerase-like protein (cupin superfamily)